MKNTHNKNYRKNKLKKIKEAKKAKRKIKFQQRLNNSVTVNTPINFFHYTKISTFVSVVLMLACLFLFSSIRSNQLNDNLCQKNANNKLSSTNKIYANLLNPYFQYFEANRKKQANVKSDLYKQIISIVKNTPMEKMVDDIAGRKRPVAAFIVGIAMKESKFGKFSPKKDGLECYNYWGYRGKENTTKSGYSCFDNPSQAIKIVGDRIESIVQKGAKHPAQMISWKCGSTCAGHSQESVEKWIQDVAIHYYELNPIKEIAKT